MDDAAARKVFIVELVEPSVTVPGPVADRGVHDTCITWTQNRREENILVIFQCLHLFHQNFQEFHNLLEFGIITLRMT